MNTVNRISSKYHSLPWHASLSKPYLSAYKPYMEIPIYSRMNW